MEIWNPSYFERMNLVAVYSLFQSKVKYIAQMDADSLTKDPMDHLRVKYHITKGRKLPASGES